MMLRRGCRKGAGYSRPLPDFFRVPAEDFPEKTITLVFGEKVLAVLLNRIKKVRKK